VDRPAALRGASMIPSESVLSSYWWRLQQDSRVCVAHSLDFCTTTAPCRGNIPVRFSMVMLLLWKRFWHNQVPIHRCGHFGGRCGECASIRSALTINSKKHLHIHARCTGTVVFKPRTGPGEDSAPSPKSRPRSCAETGRFAEGLCVIKRKPFRIPRFVIITRELFLFWPSTSSTGARRIQRVWYLHNGVPGNLLQ
jgi:hypothetical protein